MKEHPLSKAADRAGGVDALCAKLNISRRTYASWRDGVPPVRVAKVIEVTGLPVSQIAPALARAIEAA